MFTLSNFLDNKPIKKHEKQEIAGFHFTVATNTKLAI